MMERKRRTNGIEPPRGVDARVHVNGGTVALAQRWDEPEGRTGSVANAIGRWKCNEAATFSGLRVLYLRQTQKNTKIDYQALT